MNEQQLEVKVLRVAGYMEPQVKVYLKEGDLPALPKGRKSRKGLLVQFEGRGLTGLFKITSVVYSRFPGFYRVTLKVVDSI